MAGQPFWKTILARKVSAVSLRIFRDGPDHNQLVSPRTAYRWHFGGVEGGLRVPWEHQKFLSLLERLNYPEAAADEGLRLETLSESGHGIADILSSVPGLVEVLQQQRVEGEQLIHLELEMSAQELVMHPFELSETPGQHSWLALQTGVPVTITRRKPGQPAAVIPWNRPPHVLFAWSDAGGKVEHKEHKTKLEEALERWRDPEAGLPLVEIARASDAHIQETIEGAAKPFTHVHLLAHGEAADSGRGFELALFDGDGRRKKSVGRQALAGALCPPKLEKRNLPAVITLASCDSGSTDSVIESSASIGQELHGMGIPLVVASQFRLSAAGAVLMVEHLYGGLLAGEDPRFVLHRLRSRLSSDLKDYHDWASLVCYAAFPPDLERQLEEIQPGVGRRPAREDFLPEFACSDFEAFDQEVVHCVIVGSENEKQAKKRGERKITLYTQTRRACRAAGSSIRELCAEYWSKRRRIVGATDRRRFDADREVSISEVAVAEAYRSWEALDRAVRAMCWADIAVFDVSGFEPGVMMLLGIRAAVRRGVSLCCLWQEEESAIVPQLPFNIQNLSWSSWSSKTSGDYPNRLAELIKTGLEELDDLPHYLDLPAFDSLRILGTSSKSARPITREEKVLVLCPFASEYREHNFELFIRPELKGILGEGTKIERLGDDRSPRVVYQKLYEAIRRTEMCIADWTRYRANVFLELGVRLAISNLGAVQILEDPDSREEDVDSEDRPEDITLRELPGHVRDMEALFRPITYRCLDGDTEPYKMMLDVFEASKHDVGGLSTDHQRVYRTVVDAVEGSHPGQEPVHAYLSRTADLLQGRDQQSEGVSQVLFVESKTMKREAEAAARELRVAAWLYLEHRLDAAESAEPELIREYLKLGDLVAGQLIARTATPRDRQLGRAIYQKMMSLRKKDEE